MVTSAGYQKIEAPSVCLRSALPLSIQKHNTIYILLQQTISYVALYFAVCLVSVVCASQIDQKHCLAVYAQRDRQTDARTAVYSSKEMRHLAQNQYLPWMSSVMKILYTYSFTKEILCVYVCVCVEVCVCVWRGVRKKSQFALSATDGGVKKGIACLFFGSGRGVEEQQRELLVGPMKKWMQTERTTYLLDSAAEGRQGESRRLLQLIQRSYSDVFVLSGALTVCMCWRWPETDCLSVWIKQQQQKMKKRGGSGVIPEQLVCFLQTLAIHTIMIIIIWMSSPCLMGTIYLHLYNQVAMRHPVQIVFKYKSS